MKGMIGGEGACPCLGQRGQLFHHNPHTSTIIPELPLAGNGLGRHSELLQDDLYLRIGVVSPTLIAYVGFEWGYPSVEGLQADTV